MVRNEFKNELLLTFYGDDFTGSTDVMEALVVNGIPTALFLEPPLAEAVKKFRLKRNISRAGDGTLQALGVAGTSRSMTPDEMAKELPPVFKKILKLKAAVFHYKVCSTFDSSPAVGSIGKVAELALPLVRSKTIPLLVGTPSLKRFVVFGNLFATVDNETYRIDRHPTMGRHPVTPMDEGDIRRHLAKQTTLPVHLFDLLHQQGSDSVIDARYKNLIKDRNGFILFDCLDTDHMRTSGRLVWENRSDEPVFVIGASGAEYALCEWWHENGWITRPPAPASPGPADRLLVMSGSCSPVTEEQIQWGLHNGFHGLPINTAAIVSPDIWGHEFNRVVTEAVTLLEQGKDVIAYSALGPEDSMIKKTKEALQKAGKGSESPSMVLGREQGMILKEILERVSLRRVMVTGGDTSGYVTQQLGIFALEAILPLAPGGPLCISHAHTAAFDGLEIALKGGQIGKDDYFGHVKAGDNIE